MAFLILFALSLLGIIVCLKVLQRNKSLFEMLEFVLNRIKLIQDLDLRESMLKETEEVVDNYYSNVISFKEIRLENFFSEEFCKNLKL